MDSNTSITPDNLDTIRLSLNSKRNLRTRASVKSPLIPGSKKAVTTGELPVKTWKATSALHWPSSSHLYPLPHPPLFHKLAKDKPWPLWSPLPPNGSLYTISGTFNFAFAILFNFPSQYFSAIGLCVIFRFGRNLPPILRRTPNLRDSKTKRDPCIHLICYRAFTFLGANFHWTSQTYEHHQLLVQKVHRRQRLHTATLFLWPIPSSFATTNGISFDFFSSG